MSEAQRYHVISPIAAGGMAEVFRGESAGIEGFRKKVAIKRVLPKLSANREFINMFLDEARLGAYLSHSKCVQVFDIGQGGGAHFIVMEYVDGSDLKGVLEHLQATNRSMRVEVACRIALDIAEGLAYAHNACDHNGQPLEIVHRDISPHNVLMTKYGEVKLVDFGLAKASSHLTDEDEDIVKGKFGYLAPEVTLGQKADRRVDIFAAGILLWEMLTGRRLFLGESDVETFKQVRAAEIPDPRQFRNDIGDNVMHVLMRALARDPNERYPNADELAKDLSIVLMQLDAPANYLDVAELVIAAAADRDKKKASKPVVMGDLVLDALHDFSGSPGTAPAQQESKLGTRGVEAAKTGASFEDPSAWGLDSLFDETNPGSPSPVARAPAAAAPAAPAGAAPARPAAPAPPAAPPRARVQEAPTRQGGPFWRRWFGS